MQRSTLALQTPKFLDAETVLLIHNRQIERFGGTTGVRDLGLMESALAQPQATFDGELLHPTLADQAGAYLYHLAKNHPFVDGNKRTAFAVMDTFIRLNGVHLGLSPEQAYELTMQVAQGQLSKAELASMLTQALELAD